MVGVFELMIISLAAPAERVTSCLSAIGVCCHLGSICVPVQLPLPFRKVLRAVLVPSVNLPLFMTSVSLELMLS